MDCGRTCAGRGRCDEREDQGAGSRVNTYVVTIEWRGSEVTLEVGARDVSHARTVTRDLCPGCKIVAVEHQHIYS